MHAAKLAKSPDQVLLTIRSPEGSTDNVELIPEATATPIMRVHAHPLPRLSKQEIKSGNDWQYIGSDVNTNVYFGGEPDSIWWSEDLPGNGHYLSFQLIADDGGRELKSWLSGLYDRFSDAPLDYVVLDVRSTNGGDYMKAKDYRRRYFFRSDRYCCLCCCKCRFTSGHCGCAIG